MTLSILLALFFGGFAWGSLHTASQDYRWRNATVVRGALIKKGTSYHYAYTPPGGASVVGPELGDQYSNEPDGVVDDWARLEYDPALPEHLRRHYSKGRASTNYKQSVITGSAGAAFLVACGVCVIVFLRALAEKLR